MGCMLAGGVLGMKAAPLLGAPGGKACVVKSRKSAAVFFERPCKAGSIWPPRRLLMRVAPCDHSPVHLAETGTMWGV